jgi:hypothetical protein
VETDTSIQEENEDQLKRVMTVTPAEEMAVMQVVR